MDRTVRIELNGDGSPPRAITMLVPETEIIVTKDSEEILRKTVGPGDYVIGREPGCEVRLDVDLVSRRHAQLTVNFDHVLIQDLGSSNGTFVNGQPVTEATRLWPSQKVQVGSATIEVRRVKTLPPDVSLAPQTAAIERLLPEEFRREKKYDIGKVVAQGGMGAILDAREAGIQRRVAMKVMLDGSSSDDLPRFIAEARITGQLEHPSIVPVHELGIDENGQPFYTMKMVRGITLRKVLELISAGVPETMRKYQLPALLTIFQKVCDAMAFAHSKGVIHRDLKPENIMLDDFGVVLVMDWGLAKVLTQTDAFAGDITRSAVHALPPEASGATLSGSIMGTPQYMSPEQARGEVENLDTRSDIYALGGILFHLLYLRAPYSGRTTGEVVDKVQRGEVEWVKERASPPERPPGGAGRRSSAIPDSLRAVCKKALAYDRGQRYRTVEELQSDITAFQNGFATIAENAGLGKHLVLALKRHKAVAASIASALLLLGGVVAIAFIRVTVERDRAERALADLQRTAPTLIAEGRKLIDAQEFDDALAKISFAVTIEPKKTEYRLLRADLLQAMLRLEEADAEFQRVLDLTPDASTTNSAQTNLALCEKLLRDYRSVEAFDRPAWQALYALMDKEGRATQAVPIAFKLGLTRDVAETLLNARWEEWRKLPGWEEKRESDRIKWEDDGTLNLDFNKVLIQDLSSLQGLPISILHISETRVISLEPLRGLRLRYFEANRLPQPVDISPLNGMPLESFQCETAAINDLSPLRGMKLRKLRVASKNLKDFSAARGMPIEDLFLANAALTNLNDFKGAPITTLEAPLCSELSDISAVRTMKNLQSANFRDCQELADLTPLLDCPSLQFLVVPRDGPEIGVLRKHPNLLELGLPNFARKPVAEFWAEFDTRVKAHMDDSVAQERIRTAFAAAGQPKLEGNDLMRLPDGTFQLNLSRYRNQITALPGLRGLPVSIIFMTDSAIPSFAPLVGSSVRNLIYFGAPAIDLAPLRQCSKLEILHLSSNPALNDLSALAGMKLRSLRIYLTSVANLSPLAGMPLRQLVCSKTKVSDLTPLKTCTALEDLEADDNPALRDLSPLAGLKLQILAVSGTGVSDLTPLTSMPLRDLRLARTKVTDIRALLNCRDLENVLLPENAVFVDALRALPKLQRISFRWDESLSVPAQSASEFWKEYNVKQKGASPK
jgi:serine/threonine protein kinase